MPAGRRTVALVVPGLSEGGGVLSMASFLHSAITNSGAYLPHIVSLATSMRDADSVRLLAPGSWFRGVQARSYEYDGQAYRHVGAMLTELEFQRYRPRRVLTELLNGYDIVQVVAGTPAWTLATRDVDRPVCGTFATGAREERAALFRRTRGWRKPWLVAMTRLNCRMERRALLHARHVFALSEYSRQFLSRFVEDERLSVGVPGVDTSVYFPTSCHNDGYIISVGRFSDHRKNVRLLFDAYSRLRHRMTTVPRLVLVGSAPLKQDWDRAVSLGIADVIDVHQHVSRDELADLYRGGSIFVLSSDEEGLGIVILEAMASGLPVVSTRCGGPATAIVEGETGYLTPVGDPDALSERIQKLLQDASLRRSMGKAARREAEERFSIAAAGRTYLEKYEALLGNGA